MNSVVQFILLFSLASVCFAQGEYTSKDGNLVVTDVSVDDQLLFDSVTLNLDFSSGTFSIKEVKEITKAAPGTPLQSFESVNGYTVDFLGCQRTGKIHNFDSGDQRVVLCDTQITNHSIDRIITPFDSSTRLTDNLLQDKGALYVLSGGIREDFIDIFLRTEQTVKVSFEFWLNINSTSISSLSTRFSADDDNFVRERIEFTNIGKF